jgi:hypothetical protein
MSDGIKCCDRDYDGDGNCDIHSSAGVLRGVSGGRMKHTDIQTAEQKTCANCNRKIVQKSIIGRATWAHVDSGAMYCAASIATPNKENL